MSLAQQKMRMATKVLFLLCSEQGEQQKRMGLMAREHSVKLPSDSK